MKKNKVKKEDEKFQIFINDIYIQNSCFFRLNFHRY